MKIVIGFKVVEDRFVFLVDVLCLACMLCGFYVSNVLCAFYQSFGCVVVFFVSKVLCVFMQVLCLVCEFLVFFMQHQILDVLHIMCLCLACVECLVKNKTKQNKTNKQPSFLIRKTKEHQDNIRAIEL
jgi:hypothetical protein